MLFGARHAGLHPLGPREDEISRSGRSPFVWLLMPTDSGSAVCAAVVQPIATYKPPHRRRLRNHLTVREDPHKARIRPCQSISHREGP